MKIISWNVNGIRAILKKDFIKSIKEINPDILCLQEIKAHPHQVDQLLTEFEYHYWNSAKKSGYSGTAIFSKYKPLTIKYGMDHHEDNEGRIITLEFKKSFLVTVYAPNSRHGLIRLKHRIDWDKEFLNHLKNLEKTKPVIFCGDLNVAHKEIDLKNPEVNENNPGFTMQERKGFDNYIEHNFIDTFREFNNQPNQYTWWSYRFKARVRNIGWRIDYFCISKSLRLNLKDAFILQEIPDSDHAPVGIILNFKKF